MGGACLGRGAQRLHGDLSAVDLSQKPQEDVDALGRTDRPLKDAAQASERARINHHFIARMKGMAWQTACCVDLLHFFVDERDGRFGYYGGPAIKAEDATQARDPPELIHSDCREITFHEQVRREERPRWTTL
jgi:hypothetical protein